MKYLNWKMPWLLLLILLLITACPNDNSPSFTLNPRKAASGAVVVATLNNMNVDGATVTVAQKSASIISTSTNSISFTIPHMGNNELGKQEVVVKSGGKTETNTIEIIKAKLTLDRNRAAPGETITGAVKGVVLSDASDDKLYLANEALAITILSPTKFTFVIPDNAPSDIQQLKLELKHGEVPSQDIEILGNVVEGKVATIINPAKVQEAKNSVNRLGFEILNTRDLGAKGACSGKYAEIDVGGVPLGKALTMLESLEKDDVLLHVDPVTEWDTGGQPVDHLEVIGANIAHSQRKLKGSGITIAVLDTGVSPHSELGSRLRTNLGYNFVDDNNNTTDDFDDTSTTDYPNDGHGTPIAILAAGTELGVAPKAEVMPVKVCDANGLCLSSNVILGVCYALEKAPDDKKLVLNLSLGGDTKVRALEAILAYALDQGVLIAAAAGNEGLDGSPIHYPAAFILDGLVAVGSLKPHNNYWIPSDFSTRGNYLDIAAPGEFLQSGSPNTNNGPIPGYYQDYHGTSFATPLVAGSLALWRETHPGMSPADIEQALKDSATDLVAAGCPAQTCSIDAVGAGMLNLSSKP